MTLQDMINRTQFLMREPSADTGETVPAIATFSASTITRDLNIALAVFISRTGIAPNLTDKVVTLPIVAGLDYTLPADLASLIRIEYTQGFGGLAYPYPLEMYSFADWDDITGGGAALTETSNPYSYREPFGPQGAQTIRLNPQPTVNNVVGGDTITIYYASLGNTLVNLTDVPGIPVQFHMALVYYLLADYWPRKENDQRGQMYFSRFNEIVTDAKKLLFTQDPDGQFSITDDDTDDTDVF